MCGDFVVFVVIVVVSRSGADVDGACCKQPFHAELREKTKKNLTVASVVVVLSAVEAAVVVGGVVASGGVSVVGVEGCKYYHLMSRALLLRLLQWPLFPHIYGG